MEGEGGGLRRRPAALLASLRVRDFRRLWIADVISLLGDWAGRLALTVIVLERTGSPAWAAGVTAVSLAGYVGLGQVLATLADRRGRISVMLGADLVRAAMFGLMLISGIPVGVMLVLAFLAGLATPPFEAARSAAIPDLVPEEQYGDALALAGISVQAAIVVGNIVGGGLLVLVGASTALAINAVSFLVSAVLVLSLRSSPAATPAAEGVGIRGSLREGFWNLFDDRLVRRSLVLISITGALGTVDEALVVPYAARVGIPQGMLGVLAAAVPVGTIIGTTLIPTRGDHRRLLQGASLCAAVTAAAAAPLYFLEVGSVGAFVAFVISGGMFAISIPTNVVIGTRLRRGTRASSMGIAVGILMGSQALGAAVGGVAASWVGPPVAIGTALALASAFSLWALATTPFDAKHLARRPTVARPPEAEPDVVIDLTDPAPRPAEAAHRDAAPIAV